MHALKLMMKKIKIKYNMNNNQYWALQYPTALIVTGSQFKYLTHSPFMLCIESNLDSDRSYSNSYNNGKLWYCYM